MKEQLKKILEKVDPQIFTEEIQNELITLVESKVKLAEDTGFEKGYLEGKKLLEAQDTDHTAKLEKLVESIDDEHAKKLEKVLTKIDESHTEKLEKLVESIDTDHTAKLEKLIESIDADHTKKLQEVINTANKQITEAKETKLNESVDALSKYLDTYLEEVIPASKIADTVKLNRLEEAFSKMKEVLMINDDFVQTEIKEAIEDAKSIIDSKDSKINDLMVEKIELKSKIKQYEAEKLLENKTASFTPAKKAYIKKFFKDAEITEISERLDEAVKAYDKEETQKREMLVEKNKNKSTVIKTDFVKPQLEQINENVSEDEEAEPLMDVYVSKLNRSVSAVK